MAYILGYIIANGCICVNKNKIKNNLTLDITSAEKRHLYKIRRAINSEHKICPFLFILHKKIIFEKWEKKEYKKQNYPSKIRWHLNKISKVV